ncbi:esterase/lipase family protein [Rhodococcus sp. SGAir0479]|uniref:esterase/lipase family protein n=1 Tax=Rhodococcus sp. SGAir0479 TaxID=2567884 RepID=UPI0010CCF141|nr:alpha/beta fold hydrolase [Rhodococcus sp. SGAir0479]QCQ92198.1 alpha/beta fold hydrolase [Rhodococcus sp. SGAir0479]
MPRSLRRVAGTLTAAVAVALGSLGVGTATATADTPAGSVGLPSPIADVLPGADPAGANDWSCTPGPRHPRPVVLVHGTGMSMSMSWNALAPALRQEGYCVFALNYGASTRSWGTGDIRTSARELATFVDTVRFRTGAAQVDLVGHSQGGTVARQYLRFAGGANASDPGRSAVRNVVMLGPTTHGTTFNGTQQWVDMLTSLRITDEATNERIAAATVGLASYQQLTGSRFLAELNAGGETIPGIGYTVIASQNDDIVTPPAGAFLVPGPGAAVRNEWVQDTCPGAVVKHVGLLDDPRSIYLVQSALDPAYRTRTLAPC